MGVVVVLNSFYRIVGHDNDTLCAKFGGLYLLEVGVLVKNMKIGGRGLNKLELFGATCYHGNLIK